MGEVRTTLKPHSADADVLKKSAEIYARGNTPEIAPDGGVTQLDVRPGGPDLAARHLHEIRAVYGAQELSRTVLGLQVTRGNQFVSQVFAVDPALRAVTRTADDSPGRLSTALRSNEVGSELPTEIRRQFEAATGHDVGAVRMLNNTHSHEAADAVGARAFAVGQRVYLGRAEYDAQSDSGRELLFHELAHTVQQRGATSTPGVDALEVSSPIDAHESEAACIAKQVARSPQPTAASIDPGLDEALEAPMFAEAPLRSPHIQRVISFTTTDNAPVTHRVVAAETAPAFSLTSLPHRTLEWHPDVTIHGNAGDPIRGIAGDPFADWEAGVHQVGKVFWHHVHWAQGTPDHTHRQATLTGGLPMRDATAAGNTWYHDVPPILPPAFTAAGDVRTPQFQDTPVFRIPFTNPVAGRAGNKGWFTHGVGFVTTISARRIPGGTGAAAFRHLNHRHWNFSVDGTFDGALAIGSRVAATGGNVNVSGMIPGFDRDNPPMHGGAIMNTSLTITDT